MLKLAAEGLTLAKNFAPWFGGVAAAAALAGLAGGIYIGHRWSAAEIANAEKATVEAQAKHATFTATLANATAAAEQRASQRQAEAWDAQRARDQRINARLDALPGLIAAEQASQWAALRRTVDAANFDCLRAPMPDPFLDGVRRPGGSAEPATDR